MEKFVKNYKFQINNSRKKVSNEKSLKVRKLLNENKIHRKGYMFMNMDKTEKYWIRKIIHSNLKYRKILVTQEKDKKDLSELRINCLNLKIE